MKLGIRLDPFEVRPDIKENDRFKHLFCIGKSGSGKTTFLINSIVQEIDNGMIVLDPSGEMAQVISKLAGDRLIYVDKNNPISLNIFQRDILLSEITEEFIEVLNSIVENVNPDQMKISVQMQEILREAIKVIPKEKRTIKYLSEFLYDKNIRAEYHNHRYWAVFDKGQPYIRNEKPESAQRISARLSILNNNEVMNKFLGNTCDLNIRDVVDNKKVVVFNLSGISTEVKAFIGGLVSQLIKSYYQHEAHKESNPLYFYVDEFQLFINKQFSEFITQARKYKVSCNFACQHLVQLKKELAQIAMSAYALVVFRCLEEDAKSIAPNMGLKVPDLIELGNFEAYCSLNRKPVKVKTYPPRVYESFIPPVKNQYNFLKDEWIMI